MPFYCKCLPILLFCVSVSSVSAQSTSTPPIIGNLPYLSMESDPTPEAVISELRSVIHQASLVSDGTDVAVGRDYFIQVVGYALAAFIREQTHVSIEASRLEAVSTAALAALEECSKHYPPSADLP